jgi:hypothetical protein
VKRLAEDTEEFLCAHRPEPSDALGQFVHDALNAIRLRLMASVADKSKQPQPASESGSADLSTTIVRALVEVVTKSLVQGRSAKKTRTPSPAAPEKSAPPEPSVHRHAASQESSDRDEPAQDVMPIASDAPAVLEAATQALADYLRSSSAHNSQPRQPAAPASVDQEALELPVNTREFTHSASAAQPAPEQSADSARGIRLGDLESIGPSGSVETDLSSATECAVSLTALLDERAAGQSIDLERRRDVSSPSTPEESIRARPAPGRPPTRTRDRNRRNGFGRAKA